MLLSWPPPSGCVSSRPGSAHGKQTATPPAAPGSVDGHHAEVGWVGSGYLGVESVGLVLYHKCTRPLTILLPSTLQDAAPFGSAPDFPAPAFGSALPPGLAAVLAAAGAGDCVDYYDDSSSDWADEPDEPVEAAAAAEGDAAAAGQVGGDGASDAAAAAEPEPEAEATPVPAKPQPPPAEPAAAVSVAPATPGADGGSSSLDEWVVVDDAVVSPPGASDEDAPAPFVEADEVRVWLWGCQRAGHFGSSLIR